MQRNTACFIGHHLLRSRGLNPDNPVTPLVEWIVLSEHLWGKAEQAFDARLSTWKALREQGQAVEELATYWCLADELRALEKEVAKARQAAMPLPILWPLGPIAQQLAALDSLVQQELATLRIVHVLVLRFVIGAALDDSSPSGKAAKSLMRNVLNLKPTETRLIALWETVIRAADRDSSKLVGSTRSYVRQGIKWKARDLEKQDKGLPHGLTAHGHSAAERDQMALNTDCDIKSNSGRDIRSNIDCDGEFSEDREDPDFNMIESLDSERLHDFLRPLVPLLYQKANDSEKRLLVRLLIEGMDPSEAWEKRSHYNGLVNKGKRVRKAHSGNR
jgi:hypothetical protein